MKIVVVAVVVVVNALDGQVKKIVVVVYTLNKQLMLSMQIKLSFLATYCCS